MIKQVHSSHLGFESCLNKAKDVLFWLGMTAEIKDCVSKCETCNACQTGPRKPHDPPERPWWLHYPQSNGKRENAVKTGKKLLTKSKASGQDPYLAITLTQYWIITSPKTLLPTAETLLQPNIMEGNEGKLKERNTKQALFYNKGTKELPELQPETQCEHEIAANRQWEVVEKGIGCQTSSTSLLRGRSPRNCVQEK